MLYFPKDIFTSSGIAFYLIVQMWNTTLPTKLNKYHVTMSKCENGVSLRILEEFFNLSRYVFGFHFFTSFGIAYFLIVQLLRTTFWKKFIYL